MNRVVSSCAKWSWMGLCGSALIGCGSADASNPDAGAFGRGKGGASSGDTGAGTGSSQGVSGGAADSSSGRQTDDASGGGGGRGAGGSGGSPSGGSGGGTQDPSTGGSGCAVARPGSWVNMPPGSSPGSGSFIWTGSEVIVPGDYSADGGIYHPCENSWRTLPASAFQRYAAPLLVSSGLVYFETAPSFGTAAPWRTRVSLLDFSAPVWTDLPADGITPTQKRAVFWTGQELLWWGGATATEAPGENWTDHDDGGVYDLATRRWHAISNAGAPAGRKIEGNAVWTGTELIVWGGESAVAAPIAGGTVGECFNGGNPECRRFGDGAIYDLGMDKWTPITLSGAPSARSAHLMFWTGTDVLVVGGSSYVGPDLWVPYTDAYRYSPSTDTWRQIQVPDDVQRTLKSSHVRSDNPAQFEWTGRYLLIQTDATSSATPPTFAYDAVKDAWHALTAPAGGALCPLARSQGVCTTAAGKDRYYGVYDFDKDAWTLHDYPVRDAMLRAPSVVWTGTQIIEWGGYHLGPAPMNTCPPNPQVGCDPIGPPMLPSKDGAVYTPNQ